MFILLYCIRVLSAFKKLTVAVYRQRRRLALPGRGKRRRGKGTMLMMI